MFLSVIKLVTPFLSALMDAPTNEEGGLSHVDEGVVVDRHDNYCVQIDEIDAEGRINLSQIDLWSIHQISKGLEYEKEADKKLSGWNIFGFNSFKHRDAGKLYEKAATCYKLAKSWDRAGAAYVKSAQCHLKEGDSKHPILKGLINVSCEAATAYAEAAHAYKKTNTKECISCLEQAVNLFIQIGMLIISAGYCKEIAELYEEEQNLEQAISYYDKAADLFQCEELKYSANQCKQKIAQFSAHLERYQKVIEIYEEIARQSLNDKLLKYEVRKNLFNAGICQLCKGEQMLWSFIRNWFLNFQLVNTDYWLI